MIRNDIINNNYFFIIKYRNDFEGHKFKDKSEWQFLFLNFILDIISFTTV